jgi:hypothetical protein
MRRVISLFRQDLEEDLLPSWAQAPPEPRAGEYFTRDPEYFQHLLEYLRERNRAMEAIDDQIGEVVGD